MQIRAEIRNILLIGSAGKGKSTLANVLTGTNEFEESTNRIHGTTESKSEEFEYEGINYRVIDTVGIGDSTMSKGEILSKLEDKADIISEGLNQILFVTNGRFTQEEIEAFNLLRKAIFDDHVTDYTTIVCTNFPDFEDHEACERDRKIFREETEKFSKKLARTVVIYVDNPPARGRYQSFSKESREESRKKLLTHLNTCQEIYRPELLSKFSKMIDEFNSIISDTKEAISNIESHLNNSINYLREIIIGREKIIEIIVKCKEEVKGQMKQRSVINTVGNSLVLGGKVFVISGIWFPPGLVAGAIIAVIGSTVGAVSDSNAIMKENEAYQIFEKYFSDDKENGKTLENSLMKLKEAVERFKEIHSHFENSEYKEQNIDRKKIEIIKDVSKKILGEEINTDMRLEVDEKIEHSTGKKTLRAAAEFFGKLMLPPLPPYFIYRDHKEIENRTSLQDMEKAIKNWIGELIALKEKELLLSTEYEKTSWCKEYCKLLSET
ncbi:412_t:CDS:1 [Dentiscutata heterogama]|uniref:412_t:CDS:1 n=1 Tax=Dentiscutata heterogama TaxID=1316150 RepID=A0ACA9LDD6_9GLOM|nr:412_t:CDS:1 [Dentiscutata heterogama]